MTVADPFAAATGDELARRSADLAERMIEVRRRIHRHPELGLDNPLTQKAIVAELERIGVSGVRTGAGITSVVADIDGTADGPRRRVVLRADTDALPLAESDNAECVSEIEGRMHACGHDAHVAMLLGAAELLHSIRDRFSGSVRLFFQPGEEGRGGAKVMIAEGALEGVDAAFALHVAPMLGSGLVAVRRGPILASADVFAVRFGGKGGHASMPHETVDPIPAIGPLIDGLSHVVARETDPADPVVISVTQVNAGSAFNVVPKEAKVSGTIRALSDKGRSLAEERLRRVAEGVAASRGLEVEVHVFRGYPPTVNHDSEVGFVEEAAVHLGYPVEHLAQPLMGAEDFSYVLREVPGAFAFLGAQVPGGGPLHSDTMKLDESVFPAGAALHAAVALRLLAAS